MMVMNQVASALTTGGVADWEQFCAQHPAADSRRAIVDAAIPDA